MEVVRREDREGDGKRTKVCYVHVLTPHDECNHYGLQTCTNKFFKKCTDSLVLPILWSRYSCYLHLTNETVKAWTTEATDPRSQDSVAKPGPGQHVCFEALNPYFVSRMVTSYLELQLLWDDQPHLVTRSHSQGVSRPHLLPTRAPSGCTDHNLASQWI